nr:FAD-dependent oxidoreductase [Anaerophaga thermohalophila]
MKNTKYIILFSIFFSLFLTSCTEKNSYDVLIVGGGASGSMAGIQSARMGAGTLIVEEGPWLGGC